MSRRHRVRSASQWAAAAALATGALPALAAETSPALQQRAAVCAACHGANGNSAQADVPSLAGQPKQFITTQLVMFREGNRKNAVMTPLAAGLSNVDINELGGYYAGLAPAPAGPAVAADKATAGRALAERLNCTQCHGAALKGQQHIPRLAGQQAAYLRAQLQGFKAMTRFDMDGNMTSAAQALTPPDIDALAEYLSGLN